MCKLNMIVINIFLENNASIVASVASQAMTGKASINMSISGPVGTYSYKFVPTSVTNCY